MILTDSAGNDMIRCDSCEALVKEKNTLDGECFDCVADDEWDDYEFADDDWDRHW